MFRTRVVPSLGFMTGLLANLLALETAVGTPKIFQNNGTYSGCKDTYLYSNAGTSNYGASDRLYVYGTIPGSPVQAMLIRFDDLFGAGPNQIPMNATIVTATLSMTAYHREAGTISQYVAVYPLLKDWNAGTAAGTNQDNSSCYNYRRFRPAGNYTAADAWGTDGLVHAGPVSGLDYSATPAATCPINPARTGSVDGDYAMTWDITSLVQNWKANPNSNSGLYAFASASAAIAYFHSSDYSTAVNLRPSLTVDYYTPFSVSGTVAPQNYNDNLSDLAVKVQLIQNGGVVREQKSLLNAAGQFVIDNVVPGTYNISVKIAPWLRKVLTGRSLTTTTDLGTITLLSGDLDNDNAITSTDMAVLLANMDQQSN